MAGVSIRTAKAKATDLPVMLIQVTENSSDVSRSDKRQMSDVVDNVVRRRLEQLPDDGGYYRNRAAPDIAVPRPAAPLAVQPYGSGHNAGVKPGRERQFHGAGH